jgi:hypothetical protein
MRIEFIGLSFGKDSPEFARPGRELAAGEVLLATPVGPLDKVDYIESALAWECDHAEGLPDDLRDLALQDASIGASSAIAGIVACGGWDNFDEESADLYEDRDARAWFIVSGVEE